MEGKGYQEALEEVLEDSREKVARFNEVSETTISRKARSNLRGAW